ncbi:hypothetical protein ACI65C_006904 [Semiaphis heraclei]
MDAKQKGILIDHRIPSTDTDQEYLEQYQGKIVDSQNRQLLPLKEDLADWINKSLDIDWLNANNLLDMLDNGVILCRLAKIIECLAHESILMGHYKGDLPTISSRCFESAARHSFFSRDNTDKFIQFCRRLGVHQHLLFESDDLVLQNKPRNVVLCLMEVSRLASRFGLEPPGLVQMEKEIDAEEARDQNDGPDTKIPTPNIRHRSTSAIPMAIRTVSKLRRTESLGATSMVTLKSESDTTDDDCTIGGGNNFSELDYKVKREILCIILTDHAAQHGTRQRTDVTLRPVRPHGGRRRQQNEKSARPWLRVATARALESGMTEGVGIGCLEKILLSETRFRVPLTISGNFELRQCSNIRCFAIDK